MVWIQLLSRCSCTFQFRSYSSYSYSKAIRMIKILINRKIQNIIRTSVRSIASIISNKTFSFLFHLIIIMNDAWWVNNFNMAILLWLCLVLLLFTCWDFETITKFFPWLFWFKFCLIIISCQHSSWNHFKFILISDHFK